MKIALQSIALFVILPATLAWVIMWLVAWWAERETERDYKRIMGRDRTFVDDDLFI